MSARLLKHFRPARESISRGFFFAQNHSRSSRSARALAAGAGLCLVPAAAPGFTLLSFPALSEIQADAHVRWTRGSSWFMDDVDDVPRILSYKIDDQFFQPGLPGDNCTNCVSQAAAVAAIEAAIASWEEALAGFVQFQEAPWDAVLNSGTFPSATAFQWEGPSLAEWEADFALPPEQQQYGLDFLPGWGANIEFHSRPNGFSMVSENLGTFTMTNAVFGFAVVNRRDNWIASVDIFLNSSKNWFSRDLETVVLHEIGHALGLDHPNETIDGGLCAVLAGAGGQQQDVVEFLELHEPYECGTHPAAPAKPIPADGKFDDQGPSPAEPRGTCYDSPNFDPWVWQPGDAASTADVMYGAYTGVKRSLTDDEVGAMAFLYRPFPGDVNSSLTCTFADASMAVAIADQTFSPDPREFAAADFSDRDGVVGTYEVTQILHWAQFPFNWNGGSPPPPDPLDPPPSTITLAASADPLDIGKGGQVTVRLSVGNPQAVPVQSWNVVLQYDPAIFSNPVCIDGDFPPAGLKSAAIIGPGMLQISKIAFSPTTATLGTLADVRFDIDLPAAVSAAAATFTILPQEIVVNDGLIRVYGESPSEVVLTQPADVFASDLDATGDGAIDLNDLYSWHEAPIDVNQDMAITDADRVRLIECLRLGESADILAAP